MLQNACKTLGFKKNMVYKIPPGGGGGEVNHIQPLAYQACLHLAIITINFVNDKIKPFAIPMHLFFKSLNMQYELN